jgi:PAS domain-containing protein
MANQALPPLDDDVRAAHSRDHVEPPAGIKGGFRFSLVTGQWWWSPGMYRLHGYLPDRWLSVRPSGRLLLAHRHPDDRQAFAQAWSHLLDTGGVIAVRYRIIGLDGLVRPVFAMAYLECSGGEVNRPAREVTGVMQSDGPPE